MMIHNRVWLIGYSSHNKQTRQIAKWRRNYNIFRRNDKRRACSVLRSFLVVVRRCLIRAWRSRWNCLSSSFGFCLRNPLHRSAATFPLWPVHLLQNLPWGWQFYEFLLANAKAIFRVRFGLVNGKCSDRTTEDICSTAHISITPPILTFSVCKLK